MIKAKKGGYAEVEKFLAIKQDPQAKMRRIKGKKNKYWKKPSKNDEEEYTHTEAVPILDNEQDPRAKMRRIKGKKNKHRKIPSKNDEEEYTHTEAVPLLANGQETLLKVEGLNHSKGSINHRSWSGCEKLPSDSSERDFEFRNGEIVAFTLVS